MTGDYAAAQATLDDLERVGVSYADVTALLEKEGLEKFDDSWAELLGSVSGELEKAGGAK